MTKGQLFILIACALVLVVNVAAWWALRKIAKQMRADFECKKARAVQSFTVGAPVRIEKIRVPIPRSPSERSA